MKIENANGKTVRNITGEDLHQEIAALNEENNFLILSDGDDYIQCAVSGSGFIVEYQDSTGHYSSDDTLSSDAIEKLFKAYLSRSTEWRGMAGWAKGSGPAGADESVASPEKGESFADTLKKDLSPGKILDSVKRQVSREISRGVSRKTSGTVGRMIRKFFK
ncbi:hypothetical protein [Marispirochaeta aestuarii]|uniref:hypothetical protein n=1 Tax=Marispirochaeta aestuarii TaxID=1963862 RepID=UPI0029C6E999|nr:hypothetical protein [Marispirochaeta aestuarii]